LDCDDHSLKVALVHGGECSSLDSLKARIERALYSKAARADMVLEPCSRGFRDRGSNEM
jgi:hypothetical protein